MNLKRIVSKNIHRLRKERGYTQGKLAKKAGQTISMVCMIEAGRRCPDLNALIGYAKAFKVHPAALLLDPRRYDWTGLDAP